jgi:hypothetical protein
MMIFLNATTNKIRWVENFNSTATNVREVWSLVFEVALKPYNFINIFCCVNVILTSF